MHGFLGNLQGCTFHMFVYFCYSMCILHIPQKHHRANITRSGRAVTELLLALHCMLSKGYDSISSMEHVWPKPLTCIIWYPFLGFPILNQYWNRTCPVEGTVKDGWLDVIFNLHPPRSLYNFIVGLGILSHLVLLIWVCLEMNNLGWAMLVLLVEWTSHPTMVKPQFHVPSTTFASLRWSMDKTSLALRFHG